LKSYCFDLDGTLCTNTEGEYAQAFPLRDRILKVNELYEQGNRILIYTARGTVTGIDWRELTQNQLDEWGVKHHELRLGKPFADIYVDDRGISDGVFFDGD
jgi:FMN phosphatase YigB (HAD superfamily)